MQVCQSGSNFLDLRVCVNLIDGFNICKSMDSYQTWNIACRIIVICLHILIQGSFGHPMCKQTRERIVLK
jgi:hypothetical protein